MLPSARPLLVAAGVLCFWLLLAVAEAKVHHYTWDISYQYKSPEKLAVTVNGEAPGPTIHATQGDTLVVAVHNKLETENTTIHWHGIRQIGTPWADGVASVTQCPILPGETFTYRFVVDRPGTHLYHAHYGMQRVAGLNGMIVVTVPDGFVEPFSYDEEHTVLLGDWWHKGVYEQATALSSNPFVYINEPHSLLINDGGTLNCTLNPGGACNASRPGYKLPALFTAVPGNTYLLRISSHTSLSSLSVEIESHSMTMVEADGHYVRPFVAKSLFIYSGETYSVLIKADQDPRSSYVVAIGRDRSKTQSGTAILRYADSDYPTPPPSPTAPPSVWPTQTGTASRAEHSTTIDVQRGNVEPAPTLADRMLLVVDVNFTILLFPIRIFFQWRG